MRWRSVRAPSAALGPPWPVVWHARTYPPRHRPVTSTWGSRAGGCGCRRRVSRKRSKVTAQSSARVCGDPLGALGRLMWGIKLKYRLGQPLVRTVDDDDMACMVHRICIPGGRRRDSLDEPTISNVSTRIHANDASDSNSCACKVKDLRNGNGNGNPGADPRRNDRRRLEARELDCRAVATPLRHLTQ